MSDETITRHITIEIEGTIEQLVSYYRQLIDASEHLVDTTGLLYAEVDISE